MMILNQTSLPHCCLAYSVSITHDAHQEPCPRLSLGDTQSLVPSSSPPAATKPSMKKRAPMSFLLHEEEGKSEVAVHAPFQ